MAARDGVVDGGVARGSRLGDEELDCFCRIYRGRREGYGFLSKSTTDHASRD